ncbi:hypothetical protein AAHE18_02G114100 [Arachis hypogaea]
MVDDKTAPLVSSNDLPVLQGSYHFDGRNYLQWSQLVRITLKGRKKLNHLKGNPPATTDPKYEAWDDVDALVMTWLWHSMIPEISRNYMFFHTAKKIWNNLSQAYSMKKVTVAYYEIENKIFNTKQGSLSVTDYYGTLNHLWIELDQYQNLTIQCTPDSTTLTQFIERIRIFKFLSGLHSEFDPIRVQILGKENIPSLSELFHIVRGEETRRSVMLEGENSIDGSALATDKGPLKGPFLSYGKPPSKAHRDDRWCSYCRKTGHTKDTFFRFHGKEKILECIGGFKSTIQRCANHTLFDSESVEDPTISQAAKGAPVLSKEELDCGLMDLLSKTSNPYALTMTGFCHGEDDWNC